MNMLETYFIALVLTVVSLKICAPIMLKDLSMRKSEVRAIILLVVVASFIPILNLLTALVGTLVSLVRIVFFNNWSVRLINRMVDFFMGGKKK